METEYQGTLSTLTKYGTLNVSTARIPRKKRSKGNKVQPRTSGPSSECVSYRYDEHGNKVEGRIFTAPRTRAHTTKRTQSDTQRARTIALLTIAGNNSEVD